MSSTVGKLRCMNKILKRESGRVLFKDTLISYELQRKRVKNINLHVRNGQVWVSASPRISVSVIEDFIQRKGALVLKALENSPKKEELLTQAQERARKEQCTTMMTALCKEFYQQIADWQIPFPKLRFRKMSSRWGSCNPEKGILTFSTALLQMPKAFCEYVVAHEFVHFREANHSPAFYRELARYMPDYKIRRRLDKCS